MVGFASCKPADALVVFSASLAFSVRVCVLFMDPKKLIDYLSC